MECITVINTKIKEKVLNDLNQILSNQKLNIEDKKKLYTIAVYMLNRGYSWDYEPTIKSLSELCSNEQIIDREFFSHLLSNISDKVQESIDNKDIKNESDILIDKIHTICDVVLDSINMNDDETHKLLNEILSSKVNHHNYYFIRELIKNKALKKNSEKKQIAIEVLLRKELNVFKDTYINIWSILTNEEILSFDNERYKKALEIATVNAQAYILDNVIKKEALTSEKRKLIIDYYYEILSKYPLSFGVFDIKLFEEQMQEELFSIVHCDNLIEMEEKLYAAILDFIQTSTKPFSYAKVFANKNISEEQRKIAVEMIMKGQIVETPYYKGDCEYLIASAATSPILTTFNDNDYQRMLSVINTYNEKSKTSSKKESELYHLKAHHINKLLNNEEIFNQNIQKLLIAIEQVVLSKNNYSVDKIMQFSIDKHSIYHTDSEYRKILEILRNGASYSALKLFLNENLPFMENKNELFEIVQSENEEKISSINNELNIQGRMNMYMYHIFYGIDKDTVEQITDSDIKIKEMVLPYPSKQN